MEDSPERMRFRLEVKLELESCDWSAAEQGCEVAARALQAPVG